MAYLLTNNISAEPINCNVGYNNSWLKVDNNAGRNLYAQASYITNFKDINISLSAPQQRNS
jgi:outer membrane usher protein FimD/PapC